MFMAGAYFVSSLCLIMKLCLHVCRCNTGDGAVEVTHCAADTSTALQPILNLFCQ